MPQKKSRFDVGNKPPPPVSVWAGINEDVLGVMLRFLPCLADPASVPSVCRHWRATARGHVLPPPLPLLVLPKFRFSSFCHRGMLTAVRPALMPDEVAADDVRCVGSSDGWLVGVRPSKCSKHAGGDGECFLVNAFSHEAVSLPSLSACHCHDNYSFRSSKRLHFINCYSEVWCTANEWCYSISLRNAVLSASPDSGSKCIVAAFAFGASTTVLALWQPGMTSWYLCRGACIDGDCDLVFYQGKLYMLRKFSLCLFALELREDEHGVNASRVERCLFEPFLSCHLEHAGVSRCNLVVWREMLLVIFGYFNGYNVGRSLLKFRVFALDFSAGPYGCTEMHNFDGDCLFVNTCCCKSFPANQHDGIEGDLIYFVNEYGIHDHRGYKDPCYDTFVYNMRDGTTRPFAVELSPGNFGAPENKLAFPVWCFPSE